VKFAVDASDTLEKGVGSILILLDYRSNNVNPRD